MGWVGEDGIVGSLAVVAEILHENCLLLDAEVAFPMIPTNFRRCMLKSCDGKRQYYVLYLPCSPSLSVQTVLFRR